MAWSGTLAGLGVAAATLIATVGKQPAADPWFMGFLVVATLAGVIFVGAGLPDVYTWSASVLGGRREALRRGDRLVTDCWSYTSDGARAPVAMSATEIVLPGTGYRRQGDQRPAWVRFVVLIGCSPISPDAGGAQLWDRFQRFLDQPPVTSLVSSLSRGGKGLAWIRWATNSPGVIDAVLTSDDENDAVAAARLEVPDGMHRQFRDERCAMLILHFEPTGKDPTPMPPVGPSAWTDHIMRALELPQAFAVFLSDMLGLAIAAVPAATLGFRLEAEHDMAEIIDITGLQPLRGGHRTSQAIGYFIGDRGGLPATDAGGRMITDVLRYALKAER
jgi:hypothetical protein